MVNGEKPALQSLPIACAEIDLLIVQAQIRGTEVKKSVWKKDKKIFDLWIKKIERDPQNEDERNEIGPLNGHKNYLPDFIPAKAGAGVTLWCGF